MLEGLLALSNAEIVIDVDAERFRPVDVPLFIGDRSRARSELGWEPQIPLADTLEQTLEYWRGRMQARA